MSATEKTVKQVCTCKNCGNEAEMVITCALDETHGPEAGSTGAGQKVRGTATCTHCGNEAEMWIDI